MTAVADVVAGAALVALAGLHHLCARAAGRHLPTLGGMALLAGGLFAIASASASLTR